MKGKTTKAEKRTQELLEILQWYTFRASDDEFNIAIVNDIIQQLDKLDAIHNSGVIQHKERTEKFLHGFLRGIRIQKVKIEKYLFNASVLLIGIIISYVLYMTVSLGIDVIADREKNFLEIEHSGNSMHITVTGNDADRDYHNDWSEAQAVYPEIMTPGYIPEEVQLAELSSQTHDNITLYSSMYTDGLSISVWDYSGTFGRDIAGRWELTETEDGISYYTHNDRYRAQFETAHTIYVIEWDNEEEVRKVALGMN